MGYRLYDREWTLYWNILIKLIFKNYIINPLVHEWLYLVGMAKILILKKKRWFFSYERRAYESVDDRSLSYVIFQKPTENKNSDTNGLFIT